MSWKWIDDKEKGKADRAMDEFYETRFFIMGLMIITYVMWVLFFALATIMPIAFVIWIFRLVFGV